jgi:hypothetical protein
MRRQSCGRWDSKQQLQQLHVLKQQLQQLLKELQCPLVSSLIMPYPAAMKSNLSISSSSSISSRSWQPTAAAL